MGDKNEQAENALKRKILNVNKHMERGSASW